MNRKEEIQKEIARLSEELSTIEHLEKLNEADVQVNRFMNCYGGRDLMTNHSMDEYGIWEVRGEDPNCDLGGYHGNPILATLQGTLKDVIREAVIMPGFWQWGSGGKINKVIPREVRHV
jgi:hypothetical protein